MLGVDCFKHLRTIGKLGDTAYNIDKSVLSGCHAPLIEWFDGVPCAPYYIDVTKHKYATNLEYFRAQ